MGSSSRMVRFVRSRSAIIDDLARSQARGVRQLQLVEELIVYAEVPFWISEMRHGTYGNYVKTWYGAGRVELNGASFRGLKKRLKSVGIKLTKDYDTFTVTMRWIGDDNE